MIALAAACALLAVAPAAVPGQEVFVSLEVNGVAHGETLAILREKDILCPVEDLQRAGLHDLAGRREGNRVSLASLAPAVTFAFDEQAVALRLKVAAETLPESHIDLAENPRPRGLEYRDTPSAFLNYAVQASGSGASAFGELGASVGSGLLYSGFSAQPGGAPVRGLSNLTYDQPSALLRFIAGDFAAQPGSALGSGMLLGGVSLSRELSLDPYFISAPRQELAGAVTTPSKMDIYQDGRLVRTEDVAPGIFHIENVPGYGAAGDTRVVVRDAFGRTQELSAAARAPANLLAPGFSDYAIQLGFRRDSFGTAAFDYGSPAAVARERVGLSRWLTAGLRGEADRGVLNAGPTFTLSLPFASVQLEGAGSRSASGPGAAAALLIGGSTHRFSLSGQLLVQSPRYASLALEPALDRALAQARFNISTSLAQRLSLSAGVASSWMRDSGRNQQLVLQANWALGVGRTLSFTATTTRQGGATTASAFAGLTIPLGTSGLGTASVESGGNATLQAQKALPLGEGVGYSLRATGGATQSAAADVQAQASFGRLEASGNVTPSGRSFSVAASGGLVLARGDLFATRPVQDGFAVVEVRDVPGVHVFLNGQDAGTTGADGRLLLPAALPYQANRITIRDADVPFGYEIRGVERTVSGPVRGAALAQFQVSKVSAFPARIRVIAPDGFAVPANGALAVEGSEFPIGLDGSVYLEGLAPGAHPAQVKFGSGTCELRLVIPRTSQAIEDLGGLDCASREPVHGQALAKSVPRAIHGRVFVDENGDGSWEPGEPLLSRVRVNAGGREAVSDLEGSFWIDGVRDGEVAVSPSDPFELPLAVTVPEVTARMPVGPGAVLVDLPARRAAPSRWTGGQQLEAESASGTIRGYVMHWVDEGSERERAVALDRLVELSRFDPTYRLVLLVPSARSGAAAHRAAAALRNQLVEKLGPRKVLTAWRRTGARPAILLVRARQTLMAGAIR